jgi:hypothetical protein
MTMHDSIDLAAMFLTPRAALKEARRCDDLAVTFTTKANSSTYPTPVAAAQIAEGYRQRAKRLRQVASETAPRVHSA